MADCPKLPPDPNLSCSDLTIEQNNQVFKAIHFEYHTRTEKDFTEFVTVHGEDEQIKFEYLCGKAGDRLYILTEKIEHKD